MKPYWALFLARARTLFQYRIAAMAGLVTQWVFGFIMISVLSAFYGSTTAEQPMTLAQTVTYTWLGQAMLGTLPWNIDGETGNSIRNGTIAYDLTRPLDLYTHWFARLVAHRTAPTLLKAIPMFLIATFLMPAQFAMQWPAPASFFSWLLSIVGVLVLSCSITALMQTSLFWTVTGDGVTRIVPHIVTLFSGMVIPLPLMPDWLQKFLHYQPFSGLVSTPSLLFCEVLPPGAVWETLALQLTWSAVFIVCGRFALQRGLNRLTVAGG